MTLVALLAVTTGAWAADVLNIVVSGTSATIKYDGNASNNPYLSGSGWKQGSYYWEEVSTIRPNITTVTIDASCNNYNGTSLNGLFSSFSGLTTINGLENLNTANVQNMEEMFSGCSSLTSLDLSSFNTASVTTMGLMFTGCSSLTSLDLSSWNTENVEMTYSLFAECSELTTVDLSGWNTANVRNTNYMFGKCPKLENIYVGDGWSTVAVTTSDIMFKDCTKLPNFDANKVDKTNAHTGDGGYLKVKPASTGIDLTPDATRKIWTLAEMPGGNVELIPEYYPGMLTFGNAIEGGKLEVVGIDLVTTSFTPPSGWHQNSTQLASSHFEGFKGVTEEEAKAWSGVPATGKVALYYNYDETEQKWDMIYFEDGAISQNHKEQSQQLATIYNLPTFNFSVFYTTGMQMPAGFERDEEGNYYVEAGTEFQVKGVPAEGFHLVSVTDGTNDIEVDADGIATITMPDEYADLTLTATFSDKYTVTLNAEGLSDEEAANWKAATGDNEPAAFPLENVSAGTEVKVTYTGTKKVLGVKAEKKAAGKPVATLIAAPTPYGYICVYDDIFETLGTAEGGTLMYKVTTTNVKPTSTEGFSTSNPKGVENSGGNWKNYIWYYIKGDDSHSDSEIFGPIEVNVWLM